jgi:hypothetical protein
LILTIKDINHMKALGKTPDDNLPPEQIPISGLPIFHPLSKSISRMTTGRGKNE